MWKVRRIPVQLDVIFWQRRMGKRLASKETVEKLEEIAIRYIAGKV
jgi:hypothetical protein